MRNLILAFAFSLVTSAAARADNLAPDAFVGTYKLLKTNMGLLCDHEIIGVLGHSLNGHDDSYVQLDLGAFNFTAVNLGPQNFEDELAQTVTNSYTTSDSIVMESKDVSKPYGETSVSKTVATLNGDHLHVVSHSRYTSPNRPARHTQFDCLYKKVSSVY